MPGGVGRGRARKMTAQTKRKSGKKRVRARVPASAEITRPLPSYNNGEGPRLPRACARPSPEDNGGRISARALLKIHSLQRERSGLGQSASHSRRRCRPAIAAFLRSRTAAPAPFRRRLATELRVRAVSNYARHPGRTGPRGGARAGLMGFLTRGLKGGILSRFREFWFSWGTATLDRVVRGGWEGV